MALIPSEYQSLWNRINTVDNGMGFWFASVHIETKQELINMGYSGFGCPNPNLDLDYTLYSFITDGNYVIVNSSYHSQTNTAYPKLTCNIVGSGNSYSMSFVSASAVKLYDNYINWNDYLKYKGYFYYNSRNSYYATNVASTTSSDTPISLPSTITGTLTECLQWLANYTRNINIVVNGSNWDGIDDTPHYSNGGGATHIAKVSGQLSTLSSNLSDILIASGGGGGGMLIGTTVYAGADAGGISGNSINSANQSTGYAFGQGENGSDSSGGGGGLYGGYKGVSGE